MTALRTLAPYAFAHIARFYDVKASTAREARRGRALPFLWTHDDEMVTQYLQQSETVQVPASWLRR